MRLDTYGFDPFYLLRGSDNPSQEAHEIAAALVPEPASVKDPFWVRGAQNLLAGFVLHYYHEGYSFVGTITEILGKPVAYHVDILFKHTKNEMARLHLSQFIGMEGKTLAGIFAELANSIWLFATDTHFML
jgi:type IV secretory pathway TraG/TraD family ATPase VirD4